MKRVIKKVQLLTINFNLNPGFLYLPQISVAYLRCHTSNVDKGLAKVVKNYHQRMLVAEMIPTVHNFGLFKMAELILMLHVNFK